MDRRKHRWFILLGLALACSALLLLGRQWTSTTDAGSPTLNLTTQRAEPAKPDRAKPSVAVNAPRAPATAPPPAATGGTFRGRIIDAVTRRPVPKFEVRLTRVQRGDTYREEAPLTRTFEAATGRFSWSDVPAGTWTAVIASHGYQQFALAEFKLAAGQAMREVVMPLLRGHTLRGRVFDQSSGAGIGDAWIGFREATAWRGSGPTNRSERSKDDGSFELDGVPGGDIKVVAGAKDYAYREVEVVVDDDTPPVDIALSTGGTIAGMVVTAAGAPVKGSVWLYGGDISFDNESDENGKFSFSNRAAGRYVVTANTPAGTAKQEIVLAQDERREDIVLTIAEGRSVRGVVRGLRPEEFKRWFISLHAESGSVNFSTTVDERGAYVLNGVPSGRMDLTAHTTDRRVAKKIEVPADKDLVFDIVLPPGARLSGRVTQAGQPAANRIVWMGAADRKGDTLYHARTTQDGRYEIEGVPAGEYRVRADEDVGRKITIAGDAVHNIDIPLVQLGGRVIEDGGAIPIVGADVYARGTDAETTTVHAYRATDHFGQFKLTGLEPGGVVLTVYKAGYEMYREKIAYGAPITGKKIALRRGGGVEVRVHRTGDGEAERGFMVSEEVAGNDWGIDLWIPLDRAGIGYLPSALAGSTLSIQGPAEKPIVIREWDGQSLDLKF